MTKRKPRISKQKIEKLLMRFLDGTPATYTAEFVRVNRNTVNKWNKYFREKIWEHSQKTPRFSGKVEVDQSQLGQQVWNERWTKGRKVLGILERASKEVYVCQIEKQDRETIKKIVIDIVEPGSTIITDSWRAYDGIEASGYKHKKVVHSRYDKKNQWSNGKGPDGIHTANVDAFFRFCKERLKRYRGYSHRYFHLYLKECECMWNIGKMAKKSSNPRTRKHFEDSFEMLRKIVLFR